MPLHQLTDRISAAVWNLHPRWAVAAGRHEYDGQVPDLSADAITAGVERLGRLRDQLNGLDGLTEDEQQEREVLRRVVARELFDLEGAVRWRRDPAWYLEPLDVAVYLERDYAAEGLRLERAAAVVGEAGELLAAARANLETALPAPWVEWAVLRARRAAGGIEAQVEASAAVRGAPWEAARLREAAGTAAGELEAYAAWLEAALPPPATGDFALGGEGVAGWLRVSEGLEWEAGELVAAGRALLDEDAAVPVADDASEASSSPPTEGALAALQRAVREARRFVGEKGLADLSDADLQVAPGRRPTTGERAWLQAAGPYDEPATTSVLYRDAEAVPAPGESDDVAVALAFPGRFLMARRARAAPGEARRRFPSRAFQEGWAVYAGDLMAEAGFGEAHPGWLPAMRHRAILEDCRLLGVAGLHGGGMTRTESEALFAREAGLDGTGARLEALRCAADPGCGAAAVGRVVFRRLRQRWGGRPGEPSGAFHDALLSAGALPVGLLDRLGP